MKKEYLFPELQVILIGTEDLIATSNENAGATGGSTDNQENKAPAPPPVSSQAL